MIKEQSIILKGLLIFGRKVDGAGKKMCEICCHQNMHGYNEISMCSLLDTLRSEPVQPQTSGNPDSRESDHSPKHGISYFL